MKVGVVGSRNFTDHNLMYEVICEEWLLSGMDHLVSGGADGADSMAVGMLEERGWGPDRITEHLPERAVFGWPRAAFERNSLIVRDSDVLLAFFGPGQPTMRGDRHFGSGTMDTVQKAMRKRIPVMMYFQQED
jgi:hypothetical protein